MKMKAVVDKLNAVAMQEGDRAFRPFETMHDELIVIKFEKSRHLTTS